MIAPTQDDALTALRAMLLELAPNTWCVLGMGNRAPLPLGPGVLMTPLYVLRLATNHTVNNDPFPTPGGTLALAQPSRLDVQLDFYGIGAGDRALTVSTVMRDDWACTRLAVGGAAPLYVDDVRQMPLVSGEEQYLERWTLTATLAYTPVTTLPQEFAGTAEIGLISVDEAYPP